MADSLTRVRRSRISAGRPVSFPKGANLFDHGNIPSPMYLLRSGEVQLSSRNEAIFDHLTAGSFLGEKCLLPAGSGDYTATALSPVEALAFRRSELLAEMKRDPRFALRLLRDLAGRLDHYEQTIRDLVTVQAEVRLARLLFRSAPARARAAWVRLPINFTNLELAKMVGTTRWRISFLLNRFQRLGWLRREAGIWLRRDGIRKYLAEQD